MDEFVEKIWHIEEIDDVEELRAMQIFLAREIECIELQIGDYENWWSTLHEQEEKILLKLEQLIGEK
jgi:hypothetical protein